MKKPLLFKMLDIMTIIILAFVFLASTQLFSFRNDYPSIFGMLIPLGFFGFIIYKFKKEGIVLVLHFLCGAFVLSGLIVIIATGFGFVIIGIGILFAGAANFLGKKWFAEMISKSKRVKLSGKKKAS